MKKDKLNIAVVGLGFGAEFVPIYLEHPDVESVTICDANADRLQSVAERFAVKKKFSDVGEVITGPTPTWFTSLSAVLLNNASPGLTPLPRLTGLQPVFVLIHLP